MECYRQKYVLREDGDDEVFLLFTMYRRNLIAWNVMTSSGDNVSRSHNILLNRIKYSTL